MARTTEAGADEEQLIRKAGLIRACIDELPLSRRRCGKGFLYINAKGKPVRDDAILARVRSLAIPPAYTEVRIAAHPQHHIQAVGRDDAGRLQYLYHPDWEQVREARKTDRLAALSAALPSLRRRIARTLRKDGAPAEKTLAAAVALIDRSHIRVGCSAYVRSGRSRGAATLLKRHVTRDGDHILLRFHGKRRQEMECRFYAPALARVVGELMDIPGRRLFQYLDGGGKIRRISSADVNRYLQSVTGAEISAKDFRTLTGTAEAAERLCGIEPADSKRERARQTADVMREVAALLGNTPAVARKSYVHPRLIGAFEAGKLDSACKATKRLPMMSRGEAVVATLFSCDARPPV